MRFDKLFKTQKQKDAAIYSPCDGLFVNLCDVADEAFSSGDLGEGFAVRPAHGHVYVPSDGIVKMVFPTKHAFGLKLDNGAEIMVHIGINTVDLGGKGFMMHLKPDQRVKAGDLAVEVDLDFLKEKNIDATTIVVITDKNEKHLQFCQIGKEIQMKDLVLSLS